MDRETLSNYGWITIVTLVLAVMLALATPFGTYVGDGVVSIARGYVATSEKKLNDDNVKEMGSKWDSKFENGVATKEGNDTTEIKREAGSVIPTGATYTKADGTTLEGNGTNKFPDTPSRNDTYEEGDYIYTYNSYKYTMEAQDYVELSNGWSVNIKDQTKSEYGVILTEIAGKKIDCLRYCNDYTTLGTFQGSKIVTAPTIPEGVVDISNTFQSCALLTSIPTIPSNVKYMDSTFSGCTSLKSQTIIIPTSITNPSGTSGTYTNGPSWKKQ